MPTPTRKSPSDIEPYERADAERIIDAYREIVPQMTPQLARYLDLERTRPWSLLTSDFHRAKLPEYEAFSAEVEKLEGEMRKKNVPAAELARRMASLCRAHRLGFSFGTPVDGPPLAPHARGLSLSCDASAGC